MANTKEYQIKINGLSESISAVESLNKQLDNLEQKMKTISSSKVSTGGGSSKGSSALSEEERVQKEINKLKEQGAQLDAKILASQDEIYKRVDATKQLYKETIADQKSLAAQERLQANAYSNTMVGMKQQLADLKAVIQTTDLGDGDQIKKMTEQANVLTEKLKKMEEAYGQFGRNVGNYASAANGFKGLAIQVGDVTKQFDNAKQALKELKKERDTLSTKKDMGLISADEEKRLKDLIPVVAQLQSSIQDAGKPMDALLDGMQSVVALAQTGKGLSAFFGLDGGEIDKAIKNLVALQNAMQGIQTIQKQLNSREGIGAIFGKGSEMVDKFVSSMTGAKVATEGLTMGSRAATVAVRGLSMALKGIGIGLIIGAITLALEGFEKLAKSLDTTKKKEEALQRETNALNRQYEQRKELLSGSFMSGAINTEEYLSQQYKIENEYIEKQIELLRERADTLNDKSWWESVGDFFTSGENGTGFSGKKINGSTTASSWNPFGSFSYDVSSVEEAEDAWRKLNKAVKEGNDYFTEYGNSLSDWWSSLYVTVQETEDVMKGMGNIVLSDTIGEFEEVNKKFKEGQISAEEFAAELKRLTDRMNSSDVLNSVIANLDEYIPDEAVREKVQNIIDYIGRLNDEFNAVSEAQIHHWNQVRIDAMEEGASKIAAQMAEDERHEIAQYGRTQEQITLIQKKYQRKRLEETKKHNKKASSEAKKNAREQLEAERDLANLRIANMKEGLNKVLKQLEEERKQKLAKVEADGRLVGERQAEINKLYAQKEIDARREWAQKTQKVYKDMWDRIYVYALESQRKIVEVAKQGINISQENYEFGRSTNNPDKPSPYRISPDNSSYGVQGKNQISKDTAIELQLQEQNNKKLRDTYDERKKIIEKYWTDRIADEHKWAEFLYNQQVELENDSFRRQISEMNDRYREYNKKLEEAVKNGIMIEGDANKLKERYTKEYFIEEKGLIAEHDNNIKQLEIDKVKKLQNIHTEYYRERLQELRDFQTAISSLEAKQPVVSSWNITNLGETWKNNNNLLEAYRKLADEIVNLKRKLQEQLDKNEISFDDFQQANRELDSFADNVGQKMDKVKYEMTGWFQTGQLIQDINQYVQKLGQSIQEVFSAVWSYQDYMLEKEQDELDKWNEKLDKALDKQQEIVEEHKNNVDSIEDELATARGDRRQHLIDQLNAEIAAQRAAQKEEQRIKKEQEQAKKKEEALEKKRREQEYKRNVMQAFISWHLAIANGLATQPFLPVGIAMGALATALGAVQYALVKSQKPYAKGGQLDGGVAQGARHRDGGIPVLGGRASIEGGEFITNRRTTAQNVDLLEFVNSKHRKLSIDDFIDFYSTTPRKVIRGVRTKFEDGGYLPTLPSTLDVKDQLQNIVINQDNRPIVVSVVDINNKQDQVRRVQTLAGL